MQRFGGQFSEAHYYSLKWPYLPNVIKIGGYFFQVRQKKTADKPTQPVYIRTEKRRIQAVLQCQVIIIKPNTSTASHYKTTIQVRDIIARCSDLPQDGSVPA